MFDETQGLRKISWSECFGFTHLFRSFRLAIHHTNIILAFLGLFTTYLTGRVLDGIWPDASSPAAIIVGSHQESELDHFVIYKGPARQATLEWLAEIESAREDATADADADAGSDETEQTDQRVVRVGAFGLLLNHARSTINGVTYAVRDGDLGDFVQTCRSGAKGGIWLIAMHPLYATLFFLISLAIWAHFGGAICRVAALHSTRDERIGVREAMAFSRSKFKSFFAAPLMPIGVLVILGFCIFLAGLVALIPAIGDVIAGGLFFLALFAGFAIAFVLIGAAAGFSLTFPAIAVESSDAFEAWSKSYSYIYQRPWRAAFYALVSVVYGAICLLFVKFFVRVILLSVHACLGLSMNWGDAFARNADGESIRISNKLDALWQGPSLTGDTPFWGSFGKAELAHFSWFGQLIFYLWIFAIVGLVGAFVVSFFYSASTQIYCLLRRHVDATDLEDVYLDEPLDDDSPPYEPSQTSEVKQAPSVIESAEGSEPFSEPEPDPAPTTEPETEPTTEQSWDTSSAPPVEPSSERWSEPSSEPPTEPPSEPLAEPPSEPPSENRPD